VAEADFPALEFAGQINADIERLATIVNGRRS